MARAGKNRVIGGTLCDDKMFPSGDQWASKWEKLKSWKVIQGLILSLLNNDVEEYNQEMQISHGFQLLQTISHNEPIRSLTYMKSVGGIIFVTNSGTDLKSFMNMWSVQGLGSTHINKKRFSIITKCSVIKYLAKYRKFIVYSPDQKLKILDDVMRNFQVVTEITTPFSLFCIEWNPDTEEIVCGGSNGLQAYKLTEHMSIEEVDGYKIPINKLSWCQKLYIDTNHKQVKALCDDAIFIYNYEKKMVTHHLQNRHGLSLTCCVFYEMKECLITASKDGTIKVWNGLTLDQMSEIIAHTDAITDLQLHRSEPLLISCSLDFTIKVWRLDTYELFMRIDIGEPIKGMRVLNQNNLILWSDRNIKTYRLKMIHSFYSAIYSTALHLAKTTSYDHPPLIVCTCADGIVRILTALTGQIYAIVNLQFSLQILKKVAFVRPNGEFLAVLESGDVIVLDITKNPGKPSHVLAPDRKHDEQILSIAVIKRDRALGASEGPDCEYLVFAGHQNGEISLLYSSQSKLLDVCRAHLGPVEMLECSQGKLTNSGIVNPYEGVLGSADRLVSCAKDMKVKIWALVFEELDTNLCGLVCLKSIELSGWSAMPLKMCMIGSTLALAFPLQSGVSSLIMYWFSDEMKDSLSIQPAKRIKVASTPEKGVYPQIHNKSYDHKTEINGLTADSTFGIFVTTSWDGQLKIWDRQNDLIRELLFDESVSGCCFADSKGTIVIGYKNHLSNISIENYLPPSMLEKYLLENLQDVVDEEGIPFDVSLESSSTNYQSLPREPAVSNPARNVRVSRDHKADLSSMTESRGIHSDELDKKANRAMWKKLGISQKMVKKLSQQLLEKQSATFDNKEPVIEIDDPPKSRKKTREYPVLVHDERVPPAESWSRSHFDKEVLRFSKERLIKIQEERRRRLELAVLMEEERKMKIKWIAIAPDGVIPNSVIRTTLEDFCRNRTGDGKLQFSDIVQLIRKLPGTENLDKKILNEHVDRRRVRKQDSNTARAIAFKQRTVSLLPDDLKILVEAVHWSNEYMNKVPEIRHLTLKNDEVVLLFSTDLTVPSEDSFTGSADMKIEHAQTDMNQFGIDILKQISSEPWFNKSTPVDLAQALKQMSTVLPRASGSLSDKLFDYLRNLKTVYGYPDDLTSTLAESISRSLRNNKDNEVRLLNILNHVGMIEFDHPKVTAEIARIYKEDKREKVKAVCKSILNDLIGQGTDLDEKQFDALANIDENVDLENDEAGIDPDTKLKRKKNATTHNPIRIEKLKNMISEEEEASEADETVLNGPSEQPIQVERMSETSLNAQSEQPLQRGNISDVMIQEKSVPIQREKMLAEDGNFSSIGRIVMVQDKTPATVGVEGLVLKSLAAAEEEEEMKMLQKSQDNQPFIILMKTAPISEDEKKIGRNQVLDTAMIEKPIKLINGEDQGSESAGSFLSSFIDYEPETIASQIITTPEESADEAQKKVRTSFRRHRQKKLRNDPVLLSDGHMKPDVHYAGIDLGDGASPSDFKDAKLLLPSMKNGERSVLLNNSKPTIQKALPPIGSAGLDKRKDIVTGPVRYETLESQLLKDRVNLANKDESKVVDPMVTKYQHLMKKNIDVISKSPQDFRKIVGSNEASLSGIIKEMWRSTSPVDDLPDRMPEGKKKTSTRIGSTLQLPHLKGASYKWETPLPPPPDSKLELTESFQDMHEKYCEYWMMVKKRMQNYIGVKGASPAPQNRHGDSRCMGIPLYPNYTKELLEQATSSDLNIDKWHPLFRYPSVYHCSEC